MEQKKARQGGGGRGGDRGYGGGGGGGGGRGGGGGKKTKSELDVDDKFNAAMAALMTGGGAAGGEHPALDGPLEPETTETSGGISADPTMMSAAKRAVFEEGGGGIERWKEMYYREKLELKARPSLFTPPPQLTAP